MSAIERHFNSFAQQGGKRNKKVVESKPTLAQSIFIPVEYEVLKELAASEWSSLKTVDRAVKKETQTRYLAKYREFLDSYINNGDTYPNTILFYGLVWASDTGNFDYAVKLADVIANTGQRFELGFKRDAITLCCDEIMLAQEQFFDKHKTLTEEFLDAFYRIKSKKWQPDNIITTGKFYRMAGRYAQEQKDYKQAYDYFSEADTINPRAGVKKLIKEMAEKL